MRKVGVLIVHGIGDTREEQDYRNGKFGDLKCRIRGVLDNSYKSTTTHVSFAPGFYGDILTPPHAGVWEFYRRELQYDGIRSKLFNNFSDATTYTNRGGENDPYSRVHRRLREQLTQLWENLGDPDARLVIIAESLGAHVISDLIWDATGGVTPPGEDPEPRETYATEPAQNPFESFDNLDILLTTGCNIPLFIASFRDIFAFKRPNERFQWHNFYDDDDVLGYPLRILPPPSHNATLLRAVPQNQRQSVINQHSYATVVTLDQHVKIAHTPAAAHTRYWGSKQFYRPAAQGIAGLVVNNNDAPNLLPF